MRRYPYLRSVGIDMVIPYVVYVVCNKAGAGELASLAVAAGLCIALLSHAAVTRRGLNVFAGSQFAHYLIAGILYRLSPDPRIHQLSSAITLGVFALMLWLTRSLRRPFFHYLARQSIWFDPKLIEAYDHHLVDNPVWQRFAHQVNGVFVNSLIVNSVLEYLVRLQFPHPVARILSQVLQAIIGLGVYYWVVRRSSDLFRSTPDRSSRMP